MTIRAAIFDVYGTLLEVGPPPQHAEEQWRNLWHELLRAEPRLTRLEFSIACSRVVNHEHETARARGIAHPEILWPAIVTEVLPELRGAPDHVRKKFFLGQIRSGHTTTLTVQAADALRQLKKRNCVLGIASNAQAYTLWELEDALNEQALGLDIFEPDLCFWSYQHGFSKPDPHVFQILSARLELLGISRSEALMVGDRMDNDIEPARAQGWQAWFLGPPSRGANGGWAELLAALG